MRTILRLNKRLKRKPDRHRLTVILGGDGIEQYRLDIPVEMRHDSQGEFLAVPDTAMLNKLDDQAPVDWVEVRTRSLPGTEV